MYSDGILKEAMKWAPEWTTSHIQEYANQLTEVDIWNHAGLSLAMESIMQCSPFNSESAQLSVNTLEKRPKCIKNDLSKVISVLNLRSKYLGQVKNDWCANLLEFNVVFCVFKGVGNADGG